MAKRYTDESGHSVIVQHLKISCLHPEISIKLTEADVGDCLILSRPLFGALACKDSSDDGKLVALFSIDWLPTSYSNVTRPVDVIRLGNYKMHRLSIYRELWDVFDFLFLDEVHLFESGLLHREKLFMQRSSSLPKGLTQLSQ